ncbi:hypothetical protein LXL04_034024 [Taraxacum kok-saghyz]
MAFGFSKLGVRMIKSTTTSNRLAFPKSKSGFHHSMSYYVLGCSSVVMLFGAYNHMFYEIGGRTTALGFIGSLYWMSKIKPWNASTTEFEHIIGHKVAYFYSTKNHNQKLKKIDYEAMDLANDVADLYSGFCTRSDEIVCSSILEFGKRGNMVSALTVIEASKHKLGYESVVKCTKYQPKSLTIQNLGVAPDITSYNILLKSCFLAARVDLAQEIYSEVEYMKSTGSLKLDVFTYNTMIKITKRGKNVFSSYPGVRPAAAKLSVELTSEAMAFLNEFFPYLTAIDGTLNVPEVDDLFLLHQKVFDLRFHIDLGPYRAANIFKNHNRYETLKQ